MIACYRLSYPAEVHKVAVPPGVPDVRERTLIAVKPDGVQRRLVGQIIQRFEQRGFKLVGLKMLQVKKSEINWFVDVCVMCKFSV